jgi:hypothetical protein
VIETGFIPAEETRPPLDGLSGVLQEQLRLNYDVGATVVGLVQRPLPASTSSLIHEVDVVLQGGDRLELIAKNVGPTGFLGQARRVKPLFLRNPLREVEMYASLLRDGDRGTPFYFGAHTDPRRGECVLFLERVRGVDLRDVGSGPDWEAAARWLAAFHARFGGTDRPALASLVSYDDDYFRLWPGRAEANVASGETDAGRRRSLARVVDSYDRVAGVLASLPSTVVHGEFYPSNVLVRERPPARAPLTDSLICPLDWEMAGWGPGLLDLAALASGSWQEEQRRSFVRAYASATSLAAVSSAREGELMHILDHCLLHIAMQWLGWAASWTPPTRHQHDWLDTALSAARRIGLPT